MNALAMTAACFALSYAGLSGLSLAMGRHHEQVWQQPGSPSRCRALRLSGWLLLGVSLAACLCNQSVAVGIVEWFGMLSAAALVVILLLTYAPRTSAPCALACGLLGLLALVF